MPIIELKPEPLIYYPPLTLIGGVKINRNIEGNIIKDLSNLIKQLTNTLQQAYKVNALIHSGNYSIETIISPIEKEIEQQVMAQSLNQNALNVILKIAQKNKEAGVLMQTDSFYYAQKLKNKFNPEITKNFLTAIQETVMLYTGRKHEIRNALTNYCITTVTKVIT